MYQALALLTGLALAARDVDDAALEHQVLEAASHALEAAPGAPWRTAVLGAAGDLAGRSDALLIVLDDQPSIYASTDCASGDLPRICESADGVITCSRDAVRRLIALDSGRGHPSVPLLHALAHELGHLLGGGPELSADALQVSLDGSPAQRVEALVGLLERAVAAAPAEAEADAFADILLSSRLGRPPYDVSAPEVHAAVLEAARVALASAGACMIDDAPDRSPSELDIQRGARQLLCAASGDSASVILAAFEGSHLDWPGRIRALERTTGREAPPGDPAAYYAAVAKALRQQHSALGGRAPECSPEAVAAFLDGFDDVPMVCPRMSAALETASWRPAARIPVQADGEQLSLRGSVLAAVVLESGRVGLVLDEAKQVGLWTPGQSQAELLRVPCTPSWLAEDGDGLLVSCSEPAGVVEIRDGRLRLHALTSLALGGEPLDSAGASASWLGMVDGRWWLTGALREGAGFGVDVTGWGAPVGLAAWKGEGCEALVAAGATRWWRPDPAGELHGMSTGADQTLFRLSADGRLVGREDPGAWEEYAWDMDLRAGPVLSCGASIAQKRSICVDSEGSIFDPVANPLDFDMELSTSRTLEGDAPAGAVCDSASARYMLLHDAGAPDRTAWVIRHDAEDTREVLSREKVIRASLSCGAEGAAVVLGGSELSYISWLP